MSRTFRQLLIVALCLGLSLSPQLVPAAWIENGTAIAKDVPYVPTPQSVVIRMLEMAQVGPQDVVYDLGCGDGRIVITAARDFGARRGIGIDIDPQLVMESESNARVAGVEDRVDFLVQDLFETDISEASVVTLYLLSTVNLRLRPTLLSDLVPGTRVVSHAFDMGTWFPDQEDVVDGNLIYFWVIPANVSGQWHLTRADGQKLELLLEQDFQFARGIFRMDGQQGELQNVAVKGDHFEFTIAMNVAGSTTDITYAGRVTGNHMEGSVSTSTDQTWQATRVAGTAHALEPSDPAYVQQRQNLLHLQKQ